MRTVPARLLIGATLLVAGFGVLTDGSPLRLLDFKERECRDASVAVASACPAGCAARPISAPGDRSRPTECHSRLWVATCGKGCDPAPGFIRLPDGSLADGRRLLMTLSGPAAAGHEKALSDMHLIAEPRFDGLYRYEVLLTESAEGYGLEETKKRLSALPGVKSVDLILR
ncbi:MAG TPA: hypothetical protein VL283_04060 [Candidatus Baltobacteraceae bacterium]|nr:hypothetical protein [Candidatus Baltobacteraceae bacterium]